MRVLGLIPDVPTGILSSAGDNPAATLRLRHWASNGLLPFLANNAVTPYGLFVEEFDLAGRALTVDLLHTRVQARMIYSFAHMALLLGEDRYADIALAAFAPWVERLWDKKEGGWFHAVTPEGRVVHRGCDALDQAFGLLALAYLRRLGFADGDEWIGRALEALDRRLAEPRHGGFLEQAPSAGGVSIMRRQNPHMHLLEAFLALDEAGWPGDALERAGRLVDLFNCLIKRDGSIGEFFRDDWSPPPTGKERREPGHQFEWAFLLDLFAERSGRPPQRPEHLAAFGLHYGLDKERGTVPGLIDVVSPAGEPVVFSKLLWPQTEAVRYHLRRARLGDKEAASRAEHFASVVLDGYRSAGNPLWLNQIDRYGRPTVDRTPTRVFYHIVTCIAECHDPA